MTKMIHLVVDRRAAQSLRSFIDRTNQTETRGQQCRMQHT
jgi:hypothetical protein